MRDFVIHFCLIILLVTVPLMIFKLNNRISNLEWEISELEKQVERKQLQIDDLHRLYPMQERRVLKIQSDLSAREVIWMLQEIAENNDCVVVH